MRTKLFIAVFALLIIGAASSVEAAIPATYTNANFFTAMHDEPASFTQDALGNFSGTTVTGKSFFQRAVVSDIHTHLHYFSIDEAYFYISSFGLIMANSDTEALSIYLARAGWKETV